MFRYFGTKSSTVKYVADLVDGLPEIQTVADAFGGLGTIGEELKARNYKVTTCDILKFPHAFQIARIECNEVPKFTSLRKEIGLRAGENLIDTINNMREKDSWFVEEYSIKRKFFLESNAACIAGIWDSIKLWDESGLITRKERAFLISSLLNSMDVVANTAGTYYAYLKSFNRKSIKDFSFKWLPVRKGECKGSAINTDAILGLKDNFFDVLYLDPPYNKRNYAGYYHLPESLATLTEPVINSKSVAGVPMLQHNGTSEIRDAMHIEYIEKLARNVNWKYLIMHYSQGGIIPMSDIKEMLNNFGEVTEKQTKALGYTNIKSSTRNVAHNIFIVKKC